MGETTGSMKNTSMGSDPLELRDETTVLNTPVSSSAAAASADSAFDDNIVVISASATDDVTDEVTPEDIERTRAEMSQTIDAIKDKLDPQKLMEQAKDTIHDATIGRVGDAVHDAVGSAKEVASDAFHVAREKVSDAGHSAKGAGYMIADTIKENPIPAAILGIGLGWLLMSRRSPEEPSMPRPHGYDAGMDYNRANYGGAAAAPPPPRTSEAYGSPQPPSSGEYGASYDSYRGGGSSERPWQSRYTGASLPHKSDSLLDTIKENPIPAALLGVGLGWLLMNRSDGGGGDSSRYNYTGGMDFNRADYGIERAEDGSRIERAKEKVGEIAGQVKDTASDLTQKVQDTASSLTHRVGDKASDLKHRVGDTASDLTHRVGDTASDLTHRVGDMAGDVTYRVRDKAHDAATGFENLLRENPLAVGALSLVLGAAVGMAVPGTRHEHQWMGETRDRLVDRASETAHAVADRVQDVAGDALQEVKGTATLAAQSVKEEASMAFQAVKEDAKNAASDVFATAKDATREEIQHPGSSGSTDTGTPS